jgi:hypothetical protein
MMNFTKDACANGTSYKGKIVTTYDELVSKFGLPDFGPHGDGDKVTCEWALEFEDGTVATIYDWKYGETPFHKAEWNIGGKTNQATQLVYETMGLM